MSLFRPYEMTSSTTTTAAGCATTAPATPSAPSQPTPPGAGGQALMSPRVAPAGVPELTSHSMHQHMAMLLAAHTAAAAARAQEMELMQMVRHQNQSRGTNGDPNPGPQIPRDLHRGRDSPISDHGSPGPLTSGGPQPPQSPPTTCDSPVTPTSRSPNPHE